MEGQRLDLLEHKVKVEYAVLSKDEKMVVMNSHFLRTVEDICNVTMTTDMDKAFRFNERENGLKHAIATAKHIDGKVIKITKTSIITALTEEVSF